MTCCLDGHLCVTKISPAAKLFQQTGLDTKKRRQLGQFVSITADEEHKRGQCLATISSCITADHGRKQSISLFFSIDEMLIKCCTRGHENISVQSQQAVVVAVVQSGFSPPTDDGTRRPESTRHKRLHHRPFN